MPGRAGPNDDRRGQDPELSAPIRALLVGAAVPLLALAPTAMWIAHGNNNHGLEGLVIVPIMFVLGVVAPFCVAPSPRALGWMIVGTVVSGALASLGVGVDPAVGIMFVVLAAVPGVVIGSLAHDAVARGRARLRRQRAD